MDKKVHFADIDAINETGVLSAKKIKSGKIKTSDFNSPTNHNVSHTKPKDAYVIPPYETLHKGRNKLIVIVVVFVLVILGLKYDRVLSDIYTNNNAAFSLTAIRVLNPFITDMDYYDVNVFLKEKVYIIYMLLSFKLWMHYSGVRIFFILDV